MNGSIERKVAALGMTDDPVFAEKIEVPVDIGERIVLRSDLLVCQIAVFLPADETVIRSLETDDCRAIGQVDHECGKLLRRTCVQE